MMASISENTVTEPQRVVINFIEDPNYSIIKGGVVMNVTSIFRMNGLIISGIHISTNNRSGLIMRTRKQKQKQNQTNTYQQ